MFFTKTREKKNVTAKLASIVSAFHGSIGFILKLRARLPFRYGVSDGNAYVALAGATSWVFTLTSRVTNTHLLKVDV